MGVYLPQPGLLRERVYFQTRVSTPDGGGGSSATWTTRPIGTVAASVVPLSGKDQIIAQGLQATFAYQIWVRQSPQTLQVTASDRVVWVKTNGLFQIVAIQNPDQHDRFLLLSCVKGTAQ